MNTLTPQEWIEYYRFHPSEFESFVNYVEELTSKQAAEIAELKERESGLIKVLESIQYQSKRASASHDKDCPCGLCDIKRYVTIKMV